MTSEAFGGTDVAGQWTFDSQVGVYAKIKEHRENYLTEPEDQKIASWCINALRMPICFWTYGNAGIPYTKGADAHPEKPNSWARNAGLRVLIDLRGEPGSKNGFDNCDHSSVVGWHKGNDIDCTISVIWTITEWNGCMEYADVVVGVEVVNEPLSMPKMARCLRRIATVTMTVAAS